VADGIAYVDAAVAAGLDVDSFAPRLSFFFNAHNNFFEEIAKFRAARRLWARTMKERFGAKDPRSWRMRFHTQTAGSTLTAQQVDNNVVRVTVQALAAVLGGTQSLHTNSRDEALALPTEVSARLALRTQQVLASETGVADAVDPLGGSWLVESLTDELEADACRYLDEIDGLGGMVAAIEEGYPQREIQDAAYRAQVELDRCDLEVVGVNIHTMDEPEASDLHRVDPRIEQEQVQRLQRLRDQRDSRRVLDALDALQQGAVGSDNLLPLILSAVEVRATLGEISDSLRTVFGEYSDPAIV
jgi:methylmalonyl-CoA mutase N-terminal domain/subunit